MALPRITATGNIVADPELRYTNNGKAVVNFRVAANKKGRDGYEDQVTFLTVNAWNGLAENIATQFGKGDRVFISGDLVQRSYENKEGEKRTVFEVTAWEVATPVSPFNDNGQGSKTTGNSNSNNGFDATGDDAPF